MDLRFSVSKITHGSGFNEFSFSSLSNDRASFVTV